jgi:hypothetical protein
MPNGLFANASLPFSMRDEPHCALRALGLWFSRVHEIYNRRPARATVPFGAAHALGPTGPPLEHPTLIFMLRYELHD